MMLFIVNKHQYYKIIQDKIWSLNGNFKQM